MAVIKLKPINLYCLANEPCGECCGLDCPMCYEGPANSANGYVSDDGDLCRHCRFYTADYRCYLKPSDSDMPKLRYEACWRFDPKEVLHIEEKK